MSNKIEGKDYVLQAAKEQDVKFIRLWFTDILGSLKGIAITVEELDQALEEGVGFDGSAIEGFARIDESDMVAMPDPSTFSLLPWRPQKNRVARLFCDVISPNGAAFESDPRFVLKRNLDKAVKMGLTFYVGPELEYFYFKNSDSPEPLDRGGYFDLTPPDEATDLRRDTVLALEDMGVLVEHSHHEGAPSQHEVDLHYTDALTMADNTMTFRLVVKEVALKHDVHATFMPKPLANNNGSGMHINQSLFKGDDNVFFDPSDKHNISPVGYSFMAGLLTHAREITLVTNQWVNSYKRLIPGAGPLGFEAPVYTTWSPRSRSDLIRIPEFRTGKENSTRIEYRAPDAACNPYLAFSVMLAAGLEGIEKKYTCPEPISGNVLETSEEERDNLGIGQLPSSLAEAIDVAESSKLLQKCLGGQLLERLLVNKKMEWDVYRRQVTDFEIKKYLPIL